MAEDNQLALVETYRQCQCGIIEFNLQIFWFNNIQQSMPNLD